MSDALVFDTGPLSHFAQAEWLKILHALAGDREVLIPEVVQTEYRLPVQPGGFESWAREQGWV